MIVDPHPMTLGEFSNALELARSGVVTSDNNASDVLNELLIEVAVTEPNTADRREAVSAARAQYRAEQARTRELG